MKEQEESFQLRSIFYGKLLPQNRFDRRFVRVMAAVAPVWQNRAAPLLNGFRSTFIDQNKDSLSLRGLVADFRVASHLFISKWCEGFRCPHDTLLHTHRENITMTTGALTKVQDDLFPAEGHKSFSPPTHTHGALLITETWKTGELEVKLTQFGRPQSRKWAKLRTQSLPQIQSSLRGFLLF